MKLFDLKNIVAATCIAACSVSFAGKPKFLEFPKGFQWCVATAAHQIEGYNTNSDWWDWEHQPGHIKNGDVSGPACDHWNRVDEDADLIRDLHATKYRFSVEWAKIEPREGKWDLEVIEHYRHEIRALRERGIEPFITLQHFTLPRWVAKHGGFEWGGFPAAFTRYATFVVGELAHEGVRDWITFNEPMVVVAGAYIRGIFPPGLHHLSYGEILNPVTGLLMAHASAYRALHDAVPGIRIGVAHHLRVFDPSNSFNLVSRTLAVLLDRAFNWAFVDSLESGALHFKAPFLGTVNVAIPGLKGTQDFVGVNYYSRDMVSIDMSQYGFVKFGVKKGRETNDLGWEVYPKGFYRILREVRRRMPKKPVIITENGIADAKDAQRPEFIRAHLRELHRAIRSGVKVEAYCHWSLMDNFEWLEGFSGRFGLYEVDYSNFKRTPRESAKVFSEIATQNGLWDR